MRTMLFAAAAAAALVAASPASAQTYYQGANAGGVGVQVGPFGFGVGPAYGAYGGYGAYAGPYADPYWNSRRPGGYANGALGGSWGSSSPSSSWGYTDIGSYGTPLYGGYGPGGYGSFAYSGAYPAGSAYAYGNDCPTTRQRIVTRTGRVIYRTRSDCQ
jgi:hypothetical protein